MIVRLTKEMATLGLRVRNSKTGEQLVSWEDVQLLIEPGQYDNECGPDGSPWFLHGCWPGKVTDVDVANWRPDFPSLVYRPEGLDKEGRLIFHFDDRLWALPPGRYSGTLRLAPVSNITFEPIVLKVSREQTDKMIPDEYKWGTECTPDFPPQQPPAPRKKCTILSRFDIDLGTACADHMIDQTNTEFSFSYCAGDDY